jgi:hypothetical protein
MFNPRPRGIDETAWGSGLDLRTDMAPKEGAYA